MSVKRENIDITHSQKMWSREEETSWKTKEDMVTMCEKDDHEGGKNKELSGGKR